MKKIKLFCCLLLTIALHQLQAQELQARVTVLTQQLPTSVNKQRFTTLQKQLTDLLNNRKWTDDRFTAQEKIECNFLLNVTEATDQDNFKATLTVQSARPVFNSSYKSPLVNYQDQDIVFKYVEYQPVEFSETRVAGNDPLTANLTASIAYYVYIILGFDYNSFAPKGGSQFFVQAQNIVNNAPENRAISGWKAFDGQRNRYWLANNAVNTRYNVFNDILYNYYRQGLDKMYDDAATARDNMLNALTQLQTFNRENPNTMIMQFFIQNKYTELIGVFKKASPDVKSRALNILQQIDPSNADRYRTGTEMRKSILYYLIGFLLISCSSDNQIPPNVLPLNTMKAIIWDMSLADQVAMDKYTLKRDSLRIVSTSLYQQVFSVHKINKSTFYKSYNYYEMHPDLLKVLFDSVNTYGTRKKADSYKRAL